jgi:hypothetical protein
VVASACRVRSSLSNRAVAEIDRHMRPANPPRTRGFPGAEIHTTPQGELIAAVLSAEQIIELARLRDFL